MSKSQKKFLLSFIIFKSSYIVGSKNIWSRGYKKHEGAKKDGTSGNEENCSITGVKIYRWKEPGEACLNQTLQYSAGQTQN